MSRMRAVLQLMLTPGLGSKTLASLLLRASAQRLDMDDLAGAPVGDLVHLYKLRPDVASEVAQQRERAAALADELDHQDIQILAIGADEYPQRLYTALRHDAPPLLFARGNCAILTQPSIAIAGSRQASSAGIAATRVAASTLAVAGINLVSGYANGVDLAAHTAALMAEGGVTTLVLAQGILHFRAKGEIADQLSSINHLILSEFPPTLRWIARNAMQRNKTIIGLSSALLIVESGEDGGTFAAGEESLRRRTPVFVLRYAQPAPTATGNETLIHRGAHPVNVDADGDVGVSEVLSCALSNSDYTSSSGPQQGSLF